MTETTQVNSCKELQRFYDNPTLPFYSNVFPGFSWFHLIIWFVNVDDDWMTVTPDELDQMMLGMWSGDKPIEEQVGFSCLT